MTITISRGWGLGCAVDHEIPARNCITDHEIQKIEAILAKFKAILAKRKAPIGTGPLQEVFPRLICQSNRGTGSSCIGSRYASTMQHSYIAREGEREKYPKLVALLLN